MKSIFKATAILGSSSAVSAIVGLGSAKLWAIMVGPAGLGYLTALQSLLGLATMIAGFGVNTAVVKYSAKAIKDGDFQSAAAGQKAAVMLSIGGGLGGLALLFLLSDVLNRTILDGKGSAGEVSLLGTALFFTLLANAFTGVLNAHHNVKALAKIAVFNSIFGTGILLACVWAWRGYGFVLGIITGSLLNCAASYFFLRQNVKVAPEKVPLQKLMETTKSLLRFGFPYTASMIVGTGVQLILPTLILYQLDLESVGFYRAASTVAVTSLGLVMTAMGQDYYPRLSAVSDDAQKLTTIINQQQYLLIVLLSPVILWLLFLSPIIIPLLYSPKFSYSAEILNWFLVGDIFRLLSWTLSFVILARSKSNVYFFLELVAGIATLLTSLLGMKWFGVEGLGISYLATYFIYYLFVLFAVRRQIRITYSLKNKLLILFTLLSAVGISVFTTLGFEKLRIGFAFIVCIISVVISFTIITKHFFHE